MRLLGRCAPTLLFVTACVLAASVALAAACTDSPTRGSAGQPGGRDLFLLGGSILARLSSHSDVDAEFDKLGWRTTHDAVAGRSLAGGLGIVQTTGADTVARARAMVIVLGINDWRATPTEFVAKVDELTRQIRSLNPEIRLYWVSMVVFRKSHTPPAAVRSVRILNGKLAEYAAANRIRIIDWRRIADAATDYNAADGYHPVRHGQLKLLRLMKCRVGEAPAAQAAALPPLASGAILGDE